VKELIEKFINKGHSEEEAELLVKGGYRIDSGKYSVENSHEFLDIASELQAADVYNSTSVTADINGKVEVRVAGDKCRLKISDDGTIVPTLKGIPLKGSSKVSVAKRLLEEVPVLDMYSSNGWDTYIANINNKLVKVSFGRFDSGPLVCSIKLYKPKGAKTREQLEREYNKTWRENGSKRHYSRPLTAQELSHPQYGDQANGLGSIFVDEVIGQLEQIRDYIGSVIDLAEAKPILDEIEEMLADRRR
jgi:hypothetical protein